MTKLLFARQFLAVLIIILFSSATVKAERGKVSLTSPDGAIRFVFQLTDGRASYSVYYKGTGLIDPSPLGLSFRESGELGKGLVLHQPIIRKGEDNYSLVVGKTSAVHDHYQELELPLEESSGSRRRFSLFVRIFNDGLAFRYVFPKQVGWPAYQLLEENTTFHCSGDPILLASFLSGYTTSHEGRYTRLPISQVKNDTLMDLPVLLEYPNKVYMAVTEAQLLDYAGMYLVKHNGILKSELSPLPDGSGIRVKGTLAHRSPWRVLLISNRPGTLLESNIITSLNDSCTIGDLSWLRPGKTDFHWWNGDIVPDTSFSPGINFETNQYYIDFCARNNIDYHTIIGYGGTAWYQNDGVSYAAGPHSDATIPIPGLDVKAICDYARKKGVGVRVWVHWQALYPHIDKTFEQYERWGIKGMMVDFMDRDDQEMVNIQTEILQKAARHHLHIQFHGAYKPTGLSRTYPNELTREGTLNYENDKWGDPITPDDDMNVVFTRLLAGPTDYHLGGFRAVPPSEYKARITRPLVLGTRCHMLAMFVVLESYLPMVCDYPAAYEGQDGFEFIKAIPAVWDETRVPEAVPGSWVTVARRKGTDWFVGTINNGTARNVNVPLGFLSPGQYQATIYSDGNDVATHPDQLDRRIRLVTSTDVLSVPLAAGGGQAILLKKIK
jgi:alpha-glucosidase